MSLMLNAKKGLSACQIARDLDMRRPTVWSMMHRIRKAMQTDEAQLLSGIIEMDETYLGGKPRKSSKDDSDHPRGRGTIKKSMFQVATSTPTPSNPFGRSLKRGLIGQFHKVSKKYLNKYIDEFAFRYNERKNKSVFAVLLERCVA